MSSFKGMYGLPSFGTTFIEKKLLLQKTFTKFSETIGKMILKKKPMEETSCWWRKRNWSSEFSYYFKNAKIPAK